MLPQHFDRFDHDILQRASVAGEGGRGGLGELQHPQLGGWLVGEEAVERHAAQLELQSCARALQAAGKIGGGGVKT